MLVDEAFEVITSEEGAAAYPDSAGAMALVDEIAESLARHRQKEGGAVVVIDQTLSAVFESHVVHVFGNYIR